MVGDPLFPEHVLEPAYASMGAALRESDPDRYLAILFAPAFAQPHLFAIHAFNAEIASIRERVSEALPGEMRQQWWREAITCPPEGADGHPGLMALLDTMHRFRLPAEPFLRLIDARAFDLYDDPMPTWADLEIYCGETAATLIRLSCLILAKGEDPGSAALCGHAGIAQGISGLLRLLPLHARRGQCYLPHEWLIAGEVSLPSLFAGEDSPALRAVLARLRARAREHLAILDAALPGLDRAIAPAFFPLALASPYLARMERPDYRPFESAITLAPLHKFYLFAKARWQGGRNGKQGSS